MKKLLSILLMLALILALTACGASPAEEDVQPDPQQEESSTPSEEATPDPEESIEPASGTDDESEQDWEEGFTGEKLTFTNEDGFDNAGFVEIPVKIAARYYFKANEASKNGNVTWTVYVTDEMFDGSYRYIPQTVEAAVLEDDEYLDLAAGKYIYLYCSENSFTLGSRTDMTEGAACIIGISEMYFETTNLDEAVKKSGIPVDFPVAEALPGNVTLWKYQYTDGTIRALYESVDNELIVAKSIVLEGAELAQDRTEYAEHWEQNIKGLKVNCYGKDGLASLVVFSLGDMHYSISYNKGFPGVGLNANDIVSLTMSIQ